MMRIFMAICCALLTVCPLSAQGDRTETARIYRLPRFERAVRCIKFFEGWHTEIHHPYVAYGHQLQPGERYSARTMTRKQGEALLRKDLRKFCAMFRKFGKDSLLLATLAYNVGPYRLLGSNKIPQKHADKEVRGWRPQHLSGVHRFLQLQGETAQDAAQTQEGGVCATVRALKELINNS